MRHAHSHWLLQAWGNVGLWVIRLGVTAEWVLEFWVMKMV